MVKTKVFLLCLGVIVALFSVIVCMELFALERAIARGIYTDVLDDMQDIGYLDDGLADYYQRQMVSLGWETEQADFFAGSWPRDEVRRARKENNEQLFPIISPSLQCYIWQKEPDARNYGKR